MAREKALRLDELVSYHNTKVKPKIQSMDTNIQSNSDAITVLNGADTVLGSVAKSIKDAINAFATVITEDGTINTYKEVLDWIATHGAEFADLVAEVSTNTTNIGTLQSDVTQLQSDVEDISETMPTYSSAADISNLDWE